MIIQQESKQKENLIQNYWQKGKRTKKPTGQDKGVNEIKIRQEMIELAAEAQQNVAKETDNIALEFDLIETNTKPGGVNELLGTT